MFRFNRIGKSIVSIILSFLMIAGLIPETVYPVLADPVQTAGNWTDYASDSVTPDENNVYSISDASELAWVAEHFNDNEYNEDYSGETFMLTSDIDLSAHYWTPIGNSYAHTFKGTFNGNGHTITGLRVGSQDSPYNTGIDAGLFGYVTGPISNLKITEALIYAEHPSDTYQSAAGLLSGRLAGGALVKNCDLSGSVFTGGVNATRNGTAGGVTGEMQGGAVIDSCRISANITLTDTDGQCCLGGIAGVAGHLTASTIMNCVSDVHISVPEGADLSKVESGPISAYSPKGRMNLTARNCIVRADLGGAGGFSGALDTLGYCTLRNICWIETDLKLPENESFVQTDPRYYYYGLTKLERTDMTETGMKASSFVNTLNSGRNGIDGALEWSLDADKNDGFPDLADAGITEAAVTFCTVTFMSRESVFKTLTVESGQTISKPSDYPTMEGKTFQYWYSDDPSVEYDFSTPVTSDITLYAKWKEQGSAQIKYTVRFDSKGGSYIYPQTVNAGERAIVPDEPLKKGFNFGGWYTDPDCSLAYDFDAEVNSDTVLYAKWTEAADVSISGRITDKNTGDGIRNASVALSNGQNAVTDEFGYYRISGVNPGTYTVTASASGYNDSIKTGFAVGNKSLGYDAALTKKSGGGGGAAPVNIYVSVNCVYSGIMLDGVEVKAVGEGALGTYTQITSNGGLANFTELPAGRYTFYVNHVGRAGWESYTSEPKDLTGDYQLTCSLKPNYQSLKVNVLGSFDPKTNTANAPLKGKTVTLTGVDPADEENVLITIDAYTGEDGSVTIEKLVPITWKITCSDFAYEEQEETVYSDGSGDLSEEEVTLTLPFIDSSLLVEFSSVYSDPDIFKRTDDNPNPLDVLLTGVAGTMTEGIVRPGTPDESGKVVFTGLFPGSYNLRASGRSKRYVSVTAGDGREIFTDTGAEGFSRFGKKHFDVEFEGTQSAAVALSMRSTATVDMTAAPASFSGTLFKTDMDENGEIVSTPCANTKIYIKPSAYYPQEGVDENGYEVTTDARGRYSVTLAPGLYGVEVESRYNDYFGGHLTYHEGNTDGYVGTLGWPCIGTWTGSYASAVSWMTSDDSWAYGDIGGMSLSSGSVVADLEMMEKKISYSACSPGNPVVYDNLTWYRLMIGCERDEEITPDDRTTVRNNYDYYNNNYEYVSYHPETRGASIQLTGDKQETVTMTGKTFPYVFHELSPGDYGLEYNISDAYAELESSVSWGGNITFFEFPAPGKLPDSFPEDYAEKGNPWPLSTKSSGLRIDAKEGRRTFRDIHDSIRFKFFNAEYYDYFGTGGIEQSEYERQVSSYGGEDSDLLWRNGDGTIGTLADGVYPDPPDQVEILQEYLAALPDDASYEQKQNAREAAYQAYQNQYAQWESEKENRGFPKEGGRYEYLAVSPCWDENYDSNSYALFEKYLVGYSTGRIPDKLFYYQYTVSNRAKPLPDGTVTLYFCAPKGKGHVFINNLEYIRNQELHEEMLDDLWFSVTLDNSNNGTINCDVNFLLPNQCSSNVSILSQEQVKHLLNPRTIVVKAVENGNESNILDDVDVTITYAGRNFGSASPTAEQTCFGNVTEVEVSADEYEWEYKDFSVLSTYDDGTKTETFFVPLTRKAYPKEFLIKDEAGNPVSNASIRLTGRSHGQPFYIFTHSDGKAAASDLNYQDYDVYVSCAGYSAVNTVITAEDVRSDNVVNSGLQRAPQPGFSENSVSINRKGAFIPGVSFTGSSNSVEFLLDLALADAEDSPVYYTVNAQVTTSDSDPLREVYLVDKKTFRNADFSDIPDPLATPAMGENTYNPSEALAWLEKLSRGELGNIYFRTLSNGEAFVPKTDTGDSGFTYDIKATLPLWELPPDGFEPCLIALTSNSAVQIYDLDYTGENEKDQLIGMRLKGDCAAMLNNITLMANAQVLGGGAIEKLEELTEPTGSIIPLPSFEAKVELDDDGFITYDYTVEMQLLQGKKSVSDAEKSYMSILPSTLGVTASGGWNMALNGKSREISNSFDVALSAQNLDALDYLPSVLKKLPVKVEFDEDNPPTGKFTLSSTDTRDKNNRNTQEEYAFNANGQVHIVAQASAFSTFAAVLPVGPVLASLEKSGALDIGAQVKVAVGADGTYTYTIINGDETNHEVTFKIGAGAGFGIYAKALGGALGAEANLKLSGADDNLEDMVTVSASIDKDGFHMNSVDGIVKADAHIEIDTWFINGEKDFDFLDIPFSYQFGTETQFSLTRINIQNNIKSRDDFDISVFNGRPETLVSNLLPIGGYAADEDGEGTFVYTDMTAKGGNVRLMLAPYKGNRIWGTPVCISSTNGLIPAFDVISVPGGKYMAVWSEITQANMLKTCPPSVIRYSVGSISDGKWSGSSGVLATLNSEVASKLLLTSDNERIYLAALKTAEGPVAEHFNISGFRYENSKWGAETSLANDQPAYGISACAADGSLFVSFVTSDMIHHVLKWNGPVTDNEFAAAGCETAMVSDDENAYLIAETGAGLVLMGYDGEEWTVRGVIDTIQSPGNPSLDVSGNLMAVSYTDQNGKNLYLTECGTDGGILERTALKTTSDRLKDSTALISGKGIFILTVLDGASDLLNVYSKEGYEKDPAVILAAPDGADGLIYSGKPQRLVTAGMVDGGAMKYAVAVKEPEGPEPGEPDEEAYSKTLPEGVNAGIYRVFYLPEADEDHTQPGVNNAPYVDVRIGEKTLTADMLLPEKTVIEVTGETGENIYDAPVLTVKDGDTVLIKDTDYSVSEASDDHVNAFGTYRTVIEGKGNYKGTASVSWKVMKVEKSGQAGDMFSHSAVEPQTYTGLKIEPDPVILWNGMELEKGTDYTLSYKNNINAAPADAEKNPPTITVTGKGVYKSTMSFTFDIGSMRIDDGNELTDGFAEGFEVNIEDRQYTGKTVFSKPVIKYVNEAGKTVTLKEKTDYTLEYDPLEPVQGEISVTVHGMRNYEGQAKTAYKIIKKSDDQAYKNAVVVIADQDQLFKGRAFTQEEVEALVSVRKSSAKDAEIVNQDIYTVSFNPADTLKTGKVPVTVHGKEGYGDLWKSASFKIFPRPAESEDPEEQKIEIRFTDGDEAEYTGAAVKPAFTVYDPDLDPELFPGNLIPETDYSVKYANNTAAEKKDAVKETRGKEVSIAPTVTLTFKNRYKGTLTGRFTISPLKLGSEDVSVTIADIKDNGKTQIDASSLKPVVKYGKTTLKKDKDYLIRYVPKADTEWQSLTVVPTGNYAEKEGDPITVPFRIYGQNSAVDLSDKTVFTVEASDTYPVYNGGKLMPHVTVKALICGEGKTLRSGRDYTLSCSNNTNAGKPGAKNAPSWKVTGKGAYKGSQSGTFTILPKELSDETCIITVAEIKWSKGKELKPKVTVTDRTTGRALKSGTDYTLAYVNNTEPAEADDPDPEKRPTVIITGKGNYTTEGAGLESAGLRDGVYRAYFRIYEKDITSVKVTGIVSPVPYTGSQIRQEGIVVYPDNKSTVPLKRWTKEDPTGDYEIIYDENIKAGTGRVYIIGKGAYGSRKTVSFIIAPKVLSWLVE
ncbi:MAG: carboxypeptidase regulatory-like domain-containing protein [Lachnospiraceae bacterium]|nr:carboxypeptidase regulatory-like domain-containing protein [Lachnospiraceae bacterium]